MPIRVDLRALWAVGPDVLDRVICRQTEAGEYYPVLTEDLADMLARRSFLQLAGAALGGAVSPQWLLPDAESGRRRQLSERMALRRTPQIGTTTLAFQSRMVA